MTNYLTIYLLDLSYVLCLLLLNIRSHVWYDTITNLSFLFFFLYFSHFSLISWVDCVDCVVECVACVDCVDCVDYYCTCMHTTQYTSGAPHAVWGIVSKWAALYLRNNYQNNVRRGREKYSDWSNQQRGAFIDCLLLLLLLNEWCYLVGAYIIINLHWIDYTTGAISLFAVQWIG